MSSSAVDAPSAKPRQSVPSRTTQTAQDEIGTRILLCLQRLCQQSTLYTTENEALRQQMDQAMDAVRDFVQATGRNPSITFSDRAVYVSGRLLRASRSVYAVADELRELLARMGASEITLDANLSADDLRALLEAFCATIRGQPAQKLPSAGGVRLRRGRPPSAHAAFDELSLEEQTVKTVALAVVVMRRFFEAIQRGRVELPGSLRQVTHQLVRLSEHAGSSFLRLTAARSVHDDAGRAVNAALVALGMVRQLTDDRRVLSQVTLSTLLYPVGKARAAGVEDADDPRLGMRLPRLGLDQLEMLPAATAALLVALGRMTDAGMCHGVLVYEALHVNHRSLLTPAYGGGRNLAVGARIIACAHRFQELLSDPDIGDTSGDVAIATLAQEARDDTDRGILRLLIATLRIFPRGTWVELSTGQQAVVVAVSADVDAYPRPRVRLRPGGDSSHTGAATEIDLSCPLGGRPPPYIVRVVQAPDRAAGPAAPTLAAEGLKGADDPSPLDRAERVTVKPPAATEGGGATPTVGTEAARLLPGFDGSDDVLHIPVGSSDPATAHESAAGLVSIPPPATDSTGAEAEPDVAPALQPATPPVEPPSSMRPSAQGTFQKTPLAHLLVYALDRSLTGSALFATPEGSRTVIVFRAGVPVKVRTPDMVAPLDRTLLRMGVLDEATLRETTRRVAASKKLHGRMLVEEGYIDQATLDAALEQQMIDKVIHLMGQAPQTRYAYYDQHDLLAGYGGVESIPCEPLALISAGVRRLELGPEPKAVLERLRGAPLRLHPAADLARLGLENEEMRIATELQDEPRSIDQLVTLSGSPPSTVERVVYALVITRFIDLSGGTRDPVGQG